MAFMGRCTKGRNRQNFTSILFALIMGSAVGCLFGLLDTFVTYVLIEDQRRGIAHKLSRSVLEGSFVGAVFGSIFAGLKLMM